MPTCLCVVLQYRTNCMHAAPTRLMGFDPNSVCRIAHLSPIHTQIKPKFRALEVGGWVLNYSASHVKTERWRQWAFPMMALIYLQNGKDTVVDFVSLGKLHHYQPVCGYFAAFVETHSVITVIPSVCIWGRFGCNQHPVSAIMKCVSFYLIITQSVVGVESRKRECVLIKDQVCLKYFSLFFFFNLIWFFLFFPWLLLSTNITNKFKTIFISFPLGVSLVQRIS